VDQVGASLANLAFEGVDQPGDFGSLATERGNNGGGRPSAYGRMATARPAISLWWRLLQNTGIFIDFLAQSPISRQNSLFNHALGLNSLCKRTGNL
jgi:hypothetical protein